MAAQKHPVSFLQECMAKQCKPLPEYIITTTPAGFVCTVTVDGITASGTAGSKPAAKFEAATAAVAILKKQLPNKTTKESTPVCSLPTSHDFILLDLDSPSTSKQDQSFTNTQPLTTAKHPISELQETFQQQRKPPPDYIITDISVMNSPRFRCSLTIDGEVFVSEAPAKQIARKDVAEKVLKYLKQHVPQILPNGPTVAQAPNAIDYNAIGVLNEYLQKKKYLTPAYQEQGMSQNNEFIILCNAAGKSTQGYGMNKKIAKQDAAHKMLKVLNISEEAIVPIFSAAAKITNYEEVIKKYTTLNNNNVVQSLIETQEEVIPADSTIKDVPETKQELLEFLEDLKVPYKCDTMQRDPLILYLTFQDEVQSTVLGIGKSYEEAYVDVLKRACKLKISSSV